MHAETAPAPSPRSAPDEPRQASRCGRAIRAETESEREAAGRLIGLLRLRLHAVKAASRPRGLISCTRSCCDGRHPLLLVPASAPEGNQG
jgi:hypothetical protein